MPARNDSPSVQPQWTADIDIDAALAGRLISEQFSDLRDAPVEQYGMGWDNAAFLVDGRLIFRFPRRRVFAGLIAREIDILPALASQLPLRISSPSFIGNPSQEFPWSFAGYPMIEGATACAILLDDASRTALAKPLAEFLRALHHVDVAPLIERGLSPDELGRLDHERCLANARERIAFLEQVGAIDHPKAVLDWLESHPPRSLDPGLRTIVHGDLYARHVIFGRNHLPVGVIDWGDMHLGDPAIDFALAHLMLPMSAYERFRETYGGIDDAAWITARYRAIYHALIELDYGIRAKDEGMRGIGSAALRLMGAHR